jgi:hypothetical protein
MPFVSQMNWAYCHLCHPRWQAFFVNQNAGVLYVYLPSIFAVFRKPQSNSSLVKADIFSGLLVPAIFGDKLVLRLIQNFPSLGILKPSA